MNPMIEIVRVPASEAPEWVKMAWVGLILPCDPFVGWAQTPDKSVVSLKEVTPKWSYAVPQKEALEILEKHHPEAAAWWRSHGYPKTSADENRFGFEEGDAKVVQGTVAKQEPGVVYDDMETGRWEPWIYPKGFAGAR